MARGLGFATILAYLVVGALGFDVFAGTSAEKYGLSYMLGGTGGYLVGYLLAALALGYAARRGWDRSVGGMAAAWWWATCSSTSPASPGSTT